MTLMDWLGIGGIQMKVDGLKVRIAAICVGLRVFGAEVLWGFVFTLTH